ncbi:hypothetical protein B7494_g6437 [Chlorociboria aeruginascens]|nr:hypothetical protein B7494_g6437 [Chlorociboria aeruginascens]
MEMIVYQISMTLGGCQFDRRYQILTLQNQAIKELDSDYRLYWNENHELPENENIKNLVGIKKVNAVRRFWYGDTFVVRFLEHPKTFAYDVHDTPTAIFQYHYLETVFQDMTPIEQDVLSRLPPGALEYLAITACDDGAVGNVSFEKDPHNPTMMQINPFMRKTALDSMTMPHRPFIIVELPLNVTGLLHMGYALSGTLQDIMTLLVLGYERKIDFNVMTYFHRLPIVPDDHLDCKFGTGVINTTTPAHDQDDFNIWKWKCHNFQFIKIFNDDGTLNSNAGSFEGQKRSEARCIVIAKL